MLRFSVLDDTESINADCSPLSVLRLPSYAFTLAEVLITLGIIGIVASMTIPALISNHNKKVAVTRMQKFYSTFNQALRASEVENGDMVNWTFGNEYNYNLNDEFSKKYLEKHIKILKKEDDYYNRLPINGRKLFLSDGSAVTIGGKHMVYYPVAGKNKIEGKDTFIFVFSSERHGIIPYGGFEYNVSRTNLINDSTFGCGRSENVNRRYCAALIMLDAWMISDDYPVKF